MLTDIDDNFRLQSFIHCNTVLLLMSLRCVMNERVILPECRTLPCGLTSNIDSVDETLSSIRSSVRLAWQSVRIEACDV